MQRIYTNDRSKLPAAIARDNQKHAVLGRTRERGRERRARDRQAQAWDRAAEWQAGAAPQQRVSREREQGRA